MPLIDNRQQLTLWEEFWSRYSPPKSVADVSSFDQRLVALLVKMGERLPHEAVILEIGCGGSVFLPLATLRLAIKAGIGIDYSWRGCQLARECLRTFGVLNAHVIHGDVLEANPIRENSCDLVYSFGLIEHFDDPIPILREHLRCLKVGGILVVGAPNFTGLTGCLQRWLDPTVFRWHVALSRDRLFGCLRGAGLADVTVEPFGFFNPNMISMGSRTPARRVFHGVVSAATRALTSFLDATRLDLVSPKISSYWISIGIKGRATVCDSIGHDSARDETADLLKTDWAIRP